jgi:hypothetical protein
MSFMPPGARSLRYECAFINRQFALGPRAKNFAVAFIGILKTLIKMGQPKIQKPKIFPPRFENIIKMMRVTFWVLVFANDN